MSDLIDRYLAAVAALLPKAQREDIIAELRDLIDNRVEERQAVLGRPLDKREVEALLREVGHPIAVAGRYGPNTALIGPELYPFWLFGVKALLAIAALAAIIPAGVAMLTAHGDARLVTRAVNDFIPTALSLIGFATLVGAAIERGWIKLGDLTNWKVSDLPRLPDSKDWFTKSRFAKSRFAKSRFAKSRFAKSRFDGLFELVATGLFIAWWTGLVRFPIGPMIQSREGEALLLFSPIFQTLYWPILALALVQVVSSLFLVVKPGWTAARHLAEILGAVGGLALAWALWPAQPLVTVLAPDASPAGLANLQRVLDLTFEITLWAAVAINLVKVVIHGWRLARGR